MADPITICRGTYHAERGQCLSPDGGVFAFSSGLKAGTDGKRGTTRVNVNGGVSPFVFSGNAEGIDLSEAGEADLQLCWQGLEGGSVCTEFSSLPNGSETVRSGGVLLQGRGRYFSGHAAFSLTTARYPGSVFAPEPASVANAGANIHSPPAEDFHLFGADITVVNPLNGAEEQFLRLQGLSRTAVAGGKFLFSGSLDHPLTQTEMAPLFRGRAEWMNRIWGMNGFWALNGGREALLFQEIPLQFYNAEIFEELPFGNNFSAGLYGKGGILLREGTDRAGFDLRVVPFVFFNTFIGLQADYRRARLPTGGVLEEFGAGLETPDNWALEEGIYFFLRARESAWEDPLFNAVKTGSNTEAGAEYCLGEWCFGLTGRWEKRETGRAVLFAGLRYQDQPGGFAQAAAQTLAVLNRHGVDAESGYDPYPVFVSPRKLYSPSPISGGVWPFVEGGGLPVRHDGHPVDVTAWAQTVHEKFDFIKESGNPKGEEWRKKRHADVLRGLLAEGTDGICVTCHVLEEGNAVPEILDADGMVPNPWYSEKAADAAAEAGGEYLQPEYFRMANKVMCDRAECHSVPHDRYLRHIYDLPGGRHHGVDALAQPGICAGCHILPGSPVGRNAYNYLAEQPHLLCDTCHAERGPMNHAPDKGWGPPAFGAVITQKGERVRGVQSGGRHGKTFMTESAERGQNNVSCRSCHDARMFCARCHSAMNTHGATSALRAQWGRGGRHKWSGAVLVQGAAFVTSNREQGTPCWVCHESQPNCYDNCHSGKQVTTRLFHRGEMNRHQADLDGADLNCGSCHKEQRGMHALRMGNKGATTCVECHTDAILGREREKAPHVFSWALAGNGHASRHGEAFCGRGGADYCSQCHGTESLRRNPGYSGPLDCNNLTCHTGGKIPSCEGR